MTNIKVVSHNDEYILFDNGMRLMSHHEQQCCEVHYLDFSMLAHDEFDELMFDLSNDNFFRRIAGYGIELIPVIGHPVRIPGYYSNNGYYSSDLELIIRDKFGKVVKRYDITNCQDESIDN